MSANRYSRLIEGIFNQYYEKGKAEIQFERTDLVLQAKALNINYHKKTMSYCVFLR